MLKTRLWINCIGRLCLLKVPCGDKIRHEEVSCRGVTRTVAGNILLHSDIAAAAPPTALGLDDHTIQSVSGIFLDPQTLRRGPNISHISFN
jgi:hypothetical protein